MLFKTSLSGFTRLAVLPLILLLYSGVFANSETRFLGKATENFRHVKITGDLSDAEFKIYDLINRERQKRGLRELDWDDDVARLARAYARQMARDQLFDHYDRNGKTVIERAADFRIENWRKIGENLFFCEGYRNFSALAVRGWMKSVTHRQNILDRDWTTTGIGAARTKSGKIYVTQVFLR